MFCPRLKRFEIKSDHDNMPKRFSELRAPTLGKFPARCAPFP